MSKKDIDQFWEIIVTNPTLNQEVKNIKRQKGCEIPRDEVIHELILNYRTQLSEDIENLFFKRETIELIRDKLTGLPYYTQVMKKQKRLEEEADKTAMDPQLAWREFEAKLK